MSNVFLSGNLESDFSDFKNKLPKTNKLKFTITENVNSPLKKYHRLLYSLSLIEKKLEDNYQSNHRFIFLIEIISDSLAQASISLIGFNNTSNMIVRRITENFYHHIYYFEHPIEFDLLNLGNNDYTPIMDLKKYLEYHPHFKSKITEDMNIKNFNDRIFNHYQTLCKTVHSKGVEFMGLAKNLSELKEDFNLIEHINKVNEILSDILYILYKFHSDLQYTNVEKSLISKSFSKNLRGNLHL